MTELKILKNKYKKHRRAKHIFQVITQSENRLKKKSKVQEIAVDNFAGGGGASDGMEAAFGRSIDIAINHDQDAIAMHQANHPNTRHYCEDVFSVDPVKAAAGRPVGVCWFSPDCKHFSKAKGSTPVSKKIRGLAWVTLNWASKVRPRVIILENVEEFETWGPLEAVRDPETKRVLVSEEQKVGGKVKRSERVARPGEVVPAGKQVFRPKQEKKGFIFRQFTSSLKRLGYEFEFKILRACDYGAPTTRKRLFMVARCDGKPIVWPEPTHGPRDSESVKNGTLLPYRSAAECIDWTKPGKSIFGRKKPLSPNTLKRIARGLKKFVIENPDPFIVKLNHSGDSFGGQRIQDSLSTDIKKNGYGFISPFIARIGQTGFGGDRLAYSLINPLTTITTKAEHCLISPILLQMGYGDPKGNRALDCHKPLGTITAGGGKFATATAWIKKDNVMSSQTNHYSHMTAHLAVNNTGHPGTNIVEPMATVTTGGHQMLVSSFLSKHYGGNYSGAGIDLRNPTNTVTQVDHHSLVSAFISKTYGGQTRSVASDMSDPLHTVTMRNGHSVVEVEMESSQQQELNREIAEFFENYYNKPVFGDNEQAFLTKYYGSDTGQDVKDPMHTVTSKDTFGVVRIKGENYRIVDITLRMLTPRELAKAQGVRDTYIIEQDKDGKRMTQANQIARIGNMVVPQCAKALVEANLPEMCSNNGFSEQVELLNEDFENAI